MSLLRKSAVNFEQVWEGIEQPLESLVSGEPQTLSNDKWLEMYTGIYNICTNPGAPQAEALFFRLHKLLSDHVEGILSDLKATRGDTEFLKQYCAAFDSFATGTNYISNLFRYLDRYWIKYSHCETGQAPVPGVYPVTELALHIWHDVAFTKLKHRLADSIIRLFRVSRDERSEVFDEGEYIANTVETYSTLGLCMSDAMSLYRDDLEAQFLKDTAQYYSALANNLLSQVSIAEYLKQVETLCNQERRRCEHRMLRSTAIQTRQTCCRVLVDEHAERICQDAETFLIHNQTDDLHRLFSLFSELPKEQALISFKNILKKYIERSGLDVVRKFEHEDAAKNPEGYIEALVQVRNKYYDLIKEAFGFHALMRTALDQACRSFANSHPRLPELLAKYTHFLMTHRRKSSPKTSASTLEHEEDGLDGKIENISIVFGLIDDKDVFQKYYAKFLAKRLIKESSISDDAEALLIQKLRDVCGLDFVSKLQKMMKDKMLSKELVESFDAWLESHDVELRAADARNVNAIQLYHRISFHCDVLTAGAWPISSTQADSSVQLPSAMQAQLDLFTNFYTSQSSGRKIMWVHQLSFGILQTRGFDKRYELSLSFYQMILLLLFNDMNEASIQRMLEHTKIPVSDLHHHLDSLLKAKLLLSDRMDGNDTVYKLNKQFHNRKLRLSMRPSSPVESPKEVKASTRVVEEDRKMALQAAIVRVLKTRRDITQSQLQREVAQMLRQQFVPTSIAIDRNVDILVEKDFLKRHEDDPHRLLYVA